MKKDEKGFEPVELTPEENLACNRAGNEDIPINDVRKEMKQCSEKYPPTKEERQAFYEQRIKLVESTGAPHDLKSELLEDLKQSKESADSPVPRVPIPGGVGHGVYYKDDALQFTGSTTLYCHIVTIPNVGDATNEWLYLTSTNRSPKGVEAFLSYYRLEKPTFKIFDWSKTGDDRWAFKIPYDELGKYLFSITAAGQNYTTIYVRNRTRRIAGTRWTNEVFLRNGPPDAFIYDFIYSSEYDLAPLQERRFLWWGPIVETFRPFPHDLKDIGFFEASLEQDGGPRELLTEDVTVLREDPDRFQTVYSNGRDSFIVH